MPPPDRLFLVGYRGTGKTTVGRLVAADLGWDFADADVFAAEGEAGFRDREAATLADLCRTDRLVVATGGGVVLRPANRELLRQAGFVAWLTGRPESLWARMRADPATAGRRPNLTAAGGLPEVVALLAAREPLYRAVAEVAVPTDDRSPADVAADILAAWRRSWTSR